MALVKFYRGKTANYKNDTMAGGIYFDIEKHCIYMDGTQYGGADAAVFGGFIKDVDVEGQVLKFKRYVNGEWEDVEIKLIAAADSSIELGAISNDGVTDGTTIKVKATYAAEGEDGLKLNDNGLYVDLAKTTKAIKDAKSASSDAVTSEANRAKAVEDQIKESVGLKKEDGSYIDPKGNYTAGSTSVVGAISKVDAQVKKNEDAIAKEVKDRNAAIEALDLAEIGGAGKVITTVSQTDGKVSAAAIDLTAANVAFEATSEVDGAVDVTGATVKEAIASLAKSVKSTQNAAATYAIKKVESGLANNVKEAYQLVQTINGKESNIDVQIPIYKDQTLKSVELVDEKPAAEKDGQPTNGQFMKYTYINADGDDVVVYVDCSKFLVESEFKNGLQVSAAGEVSVKLADGNESFLSVDDKGLKLSGVQKAINSAKTELIGDAATDYNTLGKLEDKIQEEAATARAAEKQNATDLANAKKELEKQITDAKAEASSAHTKVVAKDDGHVKVTIKQEGETTKHDVVTITEENIASANALTEEIARAKEAEKANSDAIGTLNGDATTEGSVAKAVSDAKTALETKIDALDKKATAAHTEVKAKANGHVTVTVEDSADKTHKVVTVKENDIASSADLTQEVTDRKDAITGLIGDAANDYNTLGKLEDKIQAEVARAEDAEAKALTDAKKYSDDALTWVEADTVAGA